MPAAGAFHEGDAFALLGLGDDHLWPSADGFRFFVGLDQGGGVVAVVDFDDVPAEGAPLVGQGVNVHDLVAGDVVVLVAVAVDDGGDGVEVEMRGAHGGFPVLPFVEFAVAEEAVDAAVAPVEAVGEGEAVAEGEAEAEGAAAHLDADGLAAHDVALELRVELAEGLEGVDAEVAGLGEDGVDDGGGVALAHD